MQSVSYREALFESMHNALQDHDETIILGQGVDDFRGTFGTTLGLADKFGAHRVQDTPLSEDAMTGICIGAALNGIKPIHIQIRADFLFLALNQIFNMAAKYKYMFGGHYSVPIFIRAMIGRSWGQGAQHSQSPQSLLSHFPGLKVIMPATSQSIIESYKQVIGNSTGPVISLEHRLLYDMKFNVDRDNLRTNEQALDSYVIREGKDLTIVASSIMVLESVRAAKYLSDYGIDCEIIDLHSTTHFDQELIINSVKKTGKLLVADTSWLAYGVCAEISRIICQHSEQLLKKPLIAMGMEATPCPTAKTLEDMFYPNQQSLITELIKLAKGDDSSIPVPDEKSMVDVYKKFKGPF